MTTLTAARRDARTGRRDAPLIAAATTVAEAARDAAAARALLARSALLRLSCLKDRGCRGPAYEPRSVSSEPQVASLLDEGHGGRGGKVSEEQDTTQTDSK